MVVILSLHKLAGFVVCYFDAADGTNLVVADLEADSMLPLHIRTAEVC